MTGMEENSTDAPALSDEGGDWGAPEAADHDPKRRPGTDSHTEVAKAVSTGQGSATDPGVVSASPEPRVGQFPASDTAPPAAVPAAALPEEAGPATIRKRPKRGERRLQILQALAVMLEAPQADRVTTAALAAKLGVSEAALYRHFASKAQMFEGLIEFIEQTVFGLINQIRESETNSVKQIQDIADMLLSFAETNPGMTRVLVGDALVTEHDRLQGRINQLIDRLEVSIKQCYRDAITQELLPLDTDPTTRSAILIAFVQGKWLRYAKSGFQRRPLDGIERQLQGILF